MDCLRGYIGLKGCGEVTPPASGLYINSLPFINSVQLSNLIDSDKDGIQNVYNDIETRALLRFTDDIEAEFAKSFQLNNTLESINLTRKLDSTTFNPDDGVKWKGFTVDLRPYNDAMYQYSALSLISIQSLSFYANLNDVALTNEVAIFDLTSGEKLFSKIITIAEGWNLIDVYQSFSNDMMDRSRLLFCAIDTTSITFASSTIDPFLSNQYYGTLRINGATAVDDTLAILQTTQLHGFSGIVSQNCSFEAVVCQNKASFKRTLLYCYGYEYLQEALNSDVLSSTTTSMAQSNEKLLPEVLADYKAALMNAVAGFNLDTSDMCITCNERFQLKEITP